MHWAQVYDSSTVNIRNRAELSAKISMRKHYLSIGHFFKNAQSIEEKYEFSFDNFKTTQSIEIACIYLHASILN